MSFLSIVGAVTIMSGSAFAAFTTTATATNTTFSASNPNLQIEVNGGGFGSLVAGPVVTGLIPGVAGDSSQFKLKNIDPEGDALPTFMKLTVKPSNTMPGSDLMIDVNCGGPTESQTYADWISTGFSIGTVPAANAELVCTMVPTLISGVGDDDAGQSAVFDAVFSGSVGS